MLVCLFEAVSTVRCASGVGTARTTTESCICLVNDFFDIPCHGLFLGGSLIPLPPSKCDRIHDKPPAGPCDSRLLVFGKVFVAGWGITIFRRHHTIRSQRCGLHGAASGAAGIWAVSVCSTSIARRLSATSSRNGLMIVLDRFKRWWNGGHDRLKMRWEDLLDRR